MRQPSKIILSIIFTTGYVREKKIMYVSKEKVKKKSLFREYFQDEKKN